MWSWCDSVQLDLDGAGAQFGGYVQPHVDVRLAFDAFPAAAAVGDAGARSLFGRFELVGDGADDGHGGVTAAAHAASRCPCRVCAPSQHGWPYSSSTRASSAGLAAVSPSRMSGPSTQSAESSGQIPASTSPSTHALAVGA